MHPMRANDPLQVEMCASQIIALQACHREWKKWWGGCNEIRAELDKCLRAEKDIRRRRNLANSTFAKKQAAAASSAPASSSSE